jgi:hypothetical protein
LISALPGYKFDESATGVDDHRPLPPDAGTRAYGLEPGDARLLHVAEIDGVVDVPHGIHVTPADGHDFGMHQLALQ